MRRRVGGGGGRAPRGAAATARARRGDHGGGPSRRTPRILLSTSEESASPVTSSAMMSSGSFFETRPSSTGTSSCMLEILRSVTRTSGFSSSATCDSWFFTKYGEMKPRSISIPSVNSTSSVSVCPSSTIVAPFWPTRLKQFEIVLPIVSEPVAITAMFRRSSSDAIGFAIVLTSAARSFDAFWRPRCCAIGLAPDATSLSPRSRAPASARSTSSPSPAARLSSTPPRRELRADVLLGRRSRPRGSTPSLTTSGTPRWSSTTFRPSARASPSPRSPRRSPRAAPRGLRRQRHLGRHPHGGAARIRVFVTRTCAARRMPPPGPARKSPQNHREEELASQLVVHAYKSRELKPGATSRVELTRLGPL